jgi:GcrA cell cycle regulator
MAWTEDKIKQLKKLWNKGRSTIEIAKELGISKNSVVGKAHRLELANRPSPIKKKTTAVKKAEVQKPKEKCTLMDLKLSTCHWPIGDPCDEDFHFCGKQTMTGKPYCTEHCKLAYTSIRELSEKTTKSSSSKQD